MTYYIKTDDEKYLIELDIEGKNILISKLDCIQNEDYPTYSGIFESELEGEEHMSAHKDMDKQYIYEIEEYSQDVRQYQVTSNVKLTEDEIRSIYTEAHEEEKVFDKLEGNVDWSNERFTDNQILNEIKISGNYSGTEYGDDCQVEIIGDIEGEE